MKQFIFQSWTSQANNLTERQHQSAIKAPKRSGRDAHTNQNI